LVSFFLWRSKYLIIQLILKSQRVHFIYSIHRKNHFNFSPSLNA